MLRGEPLIVAGFVDAGEFFLAAVLAPADGFSFGVDDDAVGVAVFDESLFLATIFYASFGAGKSVVSRLAARTLVVHAPAEIPAVSLPEEFYEVGPGPFGELFRGVRRDLRCHLIPTASA